MGFEKTNGMEDNPVNKGMVKIEMEEVALEIEYWKNAIICYGKWGVEKVCLMGNGIFLVISSSKENTNSVLTFGYYFFDLKPLIVKPWTPKFNISKEDIKRVPIWVRLPNLDIKYLGERSLYKIIG
ncbi:Alanine--tRNA ligase [Bienertia sinuspersici]